MRYEKESRLIQPFLFHQYRMTVFCIPVGTTIYTIVGGGCWVGHTFLLSSARMKKKVTKGSQNNSEYF